MKFDETSILKRKKRAKAIKIALFIVLILILYNVILVGISSINKDNSWSIFGYKAFIITSESMQPNINVGDVIITKNISQDEIKIEEIITFRRNEELTTTHRVVDIKDDDKGNKQFITKGDNNKTGDEESVAYNQIEGKVVLRIPYLGNLINFLEDNIVILIIILILLIILLIYISNNERKDKRRRKREVESKKEQSKKY